MRRELVDDGRRIDMHGRGAGNVALVYGGDEGADVASASLASDAAAGTATSKAAATMNVRIMVFPRATGVRLSRIRHD